MLLLAGSNGHYLGLLFVKNNLTNINKNGDIHDIAISLRFDLVRD